MKRTIILIAVFLFSLSLVTLAYSQSDVQQTLKSAVTNSPTSACPVGSQEAATVQASKKSSGIVDNCGTVNGWIQGICRCNLATGQLEGLNDYLCKKELQKLNLK